MNFSDSIHDNASALIEQWIIDGKSWEEIVTLSFFLPNTDFEEKIEVISQINCLRYIYSSEEWKHLSYHIKELKEVNLKTVNKLAEGTRNDAQISKSPQSAWQLYRTKLIKRGWNLTSINHTEASALKILQMLSDETSVTGPVKGLVLGHVQSGKTANMAGLIAMAADYGFNYFIILSGVIENLRMQTEKRLYNDLNSNGNLNWHIIKNPHPHRFHTYADKIDNLNLSSSHTGRSRYISVVLKNSSRLNNIIKYLYSSEPKTKQLKVLIIDDEADQASINTSKISDTDEEEKERTAINNHITNLVNGYNGRKLKAVNYICYTATPYANILNESDSLSLYPKDFVISLIPSADYIGPKQIFGLSEPEKNASLDIVREIPERDNELLNQIHKGEYFSPPSSLVKAIQWFLISAAAMKHRGHKKPISMLVHTSHLVSDHESIEEVIKNYLKHIKDIDPEGFLKQCERLYLTETADFTKRDFLTGIPDYSIDKGEVADYPEWSIIERGLRTLLVRENEEYLTRIKMGEDGEKRYSRGIHLCIDNSRSFGAEDEYLRLVYPDKTNDPGFATLFIVIGGNTLSRGLTLEGLTTSYFMRNTIASDSLMQMGRWFGYRIGYELYPRIWLNELVKERFKFVTQLDEELRDDIEEFERLGKSPKDFGIRVKNSPNNAFIQITSKNKMKGAVANTLSFEGIQKQTIIFEDDYDMLSHNINIAENFLNSLGEPFHSGSRLIWKNVDYNIIRDKFFSEYKAPDKDIMFSNLKAFIEWCDKVDNDGIMKNWNVVLSSKGDISRNSNSDNTWDIMGYKVEKVSRTVLGHRQSDNKTVSIGALRSPKDLLSDITDLDAEESKGTKSIQEVRIIREKHGVSNIPQLVIYIIDRKSEPDPNNNNTRSNLNFIRDIIGISLMIPGMKKGSNIATSLIIKINADDTEIELEE